MFNKSMKSNKKIQFKDDANSTQFSNLKKDLKITKQQTAPQVGLSNASFGASSVKKQSAQAVSKDKQSGVSNNKQDDAFVGIQSPYKQEKSRSIKREERTIQQKLKEIKVKNLNKLDESVKYNACVTSSSNCPTIMNSVKALPQMIKNSPKNSIKLDIPETIVCDKKFIHIDYIFTNSQGYLDVVVINDDQDEVEEIPDVRAQTVEVRSDTLSPNCISQIIQIGNTWHDLNFKGLKDRKSNKFKDTLILPVAVFKHQADTTSNQNETQMLYFSSSVIDKTVENHTRHDFIIQRFIMNRGMSPAIIRCTLNIQRYPNLNFEKALEAEAQAAIEEAQRYEKEQALAAEIAENTFKDPSQIQESSAKKTARKNESASPVKQDLQNSILPTEEESPVDLKKELALVDAPEINLKVFKITSRLYYNGEQLTERVKMLQKNPAWIAGAKDNHLIPQLIHMEGPVIRLDEEFLNYLLENNKQLKKLFKEKNMTDQERAQRYLRKKDQPNAADSTDQEDEDKEEINRLYDPKGQLLSSKIFSVFFEQIKPVDEMEKLQKQHIFKLQRCLQEDLNSYQTQMAGQFTTQELYYSNSNVIETNTRGGFRADHDVSRIKDQDTYALRQNMQQILKLVQKKDKYINQLVIDFLREDGPSNRNRFLQIKFAEQDQKFAQVEQQKIRAPFTLSKKNTDFQNDFILNTNPLSKLFDTIVKQEKDRQHEKDMKDLEDVKKKQQENDNKFSSKKLKLLDTGDNQKWNFSDRPLHEMLGDPAKNQPKLQEPQKDKYLQIKDIRGHSKDIKCCGQYCNIKQYDIQQDIPELYVGIIIQMQDDIVQKEQHKKICWSFGPKDDQVLPDIDSIDYKVPNSLILIDQDIKSLWKEQIIIENELNSIHKEGLTSKMIDQIYSQYIDSNAGKAYMCSTAQTKYRMKNVCHNCYKFYLKLGKQIIGQQGNIKLNRLWKISDPIFNKDKDKEQRYQSIINLMKQEMSSQVKTKVKEIKAKISKKKNESKQRNKEKKSNYKSNPYSKKKKQEEESQDLELLKPKAIGSSTNIPKTSPRGGSTSPRHSLKEGTGKEVVFDVQSQKSDFSASSVSPPKKRANINNLLEIIFSDNNEVERPVQPTMPSIYERNKKIKNRDPESGSRVSHHTRHTTGREESVNTPKKKQPKVRKPPKNPENFTKSLVPIRQARPSKGFSFPSERPPRLLQLSPSQEKQNAAQGTGPQNMISNESLMQYSSKTHSRHNSLHQSPANLENRLNIVGRDQIQNEVEEFRQDSKQIMIEEASSTPSMTNKLETEFSKSLTFSDSMQINPIHIKLMRALEESGNPISEQQLIDELTQLKCLSPQFNIQKVMEMYLNGKDISQITKQQQYLLPNQRQILKLRQAQKMKDFERDQLNAKSVFLKKSFSLPNLQQDKVQIEYVNQMDIFDSKNSKYQIHLQNQIKQEIKNEQYESTNAVNQFFKRVNKDVIEGIIGQNSINFNTKAKIAADTYNLGLPQNKWADQGRAIKIKKLKLKKQAQEKKEYLEQEQQFEANQMQIQKQLQPVRSVSVKDIMKIPKAQSEQKIKILKYQKPQIPRQNMKLNPLQNKDLKEIKSKAFDSSAQKECFNTPSFSQSNLIKKPFHKDLKIVKSDSESNLPPKPVSDKINVSDKIVASNKIIVNKQEDNKSENKDIQQQEMDRLVNESIDKSEINSQNFISKQKQDDVVQIEYIQQQEIEEDEILDEEEIAQRVMNEPQIIEERISQDQESQNQSMNQEENFESELSSEYSQEIVIEDNYPNESKETRDNLEIKNIDQTKKVEEIKKIVSVENNKQIESEDIVLSKKDTAEIPQGKMTNQSWSCIVCSNDNEAGSLKCEVCQREAPVEGQEKGLNDIRTFSGTGTSKTSNLHQYQYMGGSQDSRQLSAKSRLSYSGKLKLNLKNIPEASQSAGLSFTKRQEIMDKKIFMENYYQK